MICGLGIDIVDNERIRRSLTRFGGHFIQKILAAEEIAHVTQNEGVTLPLEGRILDLWTLRLAARFAAKEVAGKALGTGLSVGLHNIHIYNLPSGQPTIKFFNAAAQRMQQLSATHTHVSISHERTHAVAVVIVETSTS